MNLFFLTQLCLAFLEGKAFVEFPMSSVSSPSKKVWFQHGPFSGSVGGVLLDRYQWEAIREVLIMDKWGNNFLFFGDFLFQEFFLELEKKFKEKKIIL